MVKCIFLVTATCNTVTCSFTIDNVVDSATYNGNTLTITSDGLSKWSKEKLVTFESCDDSSPGTLLMKGSDNEVGGIQMFTFFQYILIVNFKSECHYFKSIDSIWHLF